MSNSGRSASGSSGSRVASAGSVEPRSPAVSVVVPAFNAGQTVGVALQSVFNQTFRDFEVIVVDDGSTDDTPRQVEPWLDRVLFIRQRHAGPAHARNTALARARGRLVAFLDADDVWLPRKLERQIWYFDRYPKTGLVHGATIESPLPVPAALESCDTVPADSPADPPAAVFESLFHDSLDIRLLTVMVRRDAIEVAGGFDERCGHRVEEWDLWLRVAARYPVGCLPVAVAVHRTGKGARDTLEKTWASQELVIEKVAALSAEACRRHRGDARRCVTERRLQLWRALAAERLWSGQLRAARAAYRQVRALDRISAGAYLYPALSLLGQPALDPVRRLRAPRAARRRTGNLVHDTGLRRARAHIVSAAHDLDDRVSRVGRAGCRILFEAASPMSMAIFGPVYRCLKRDPRIELWFTTSDESWTLDQIFRPCGITERVIPAAKARWMKFDAYINADFWNLTWLPRRPRRVHLFHGVAGKYDLDAPVRIAPVVASFDRLLFPNRDRLERYAQAGLVDADSPRAALIGYPKVDCLVDGSLDRRAIERELGVDPLAPTVLYAPTWSPHSSLNRMGEAIITALARRGFNVVVKLHDRSFDPTARASGGIDWRRTLDRLARNPRVHVGAHPDASPYMFAADALVTDHSSVGFEFMLLDRPIVVIDCPELIEKARITPEKVALLRSAAAVVSGPGEVAEAVAQSLAEPARHSAARQAISAELFYCAGGATERAVRSIYDLLALPAPTATSAALPLEATLKNFEARTT